MSAQVSTQQNTLAVVAPTLLQTSAALLFGAIVLFAVGFSPLNVAHNAAHDVRHSLAFPCH